MKEQTDEIKSYLDWANKGRSAWWLYIIGYAILSANLIVGNMWFGILVRTIFPGLTESMTGGIVYTSLAFIPTFAGVPFLTWLLHKRPWWSVAMPKLKLEGWNLGVGFLFAWVMLLASYGMYVLFGGVHISFQMPDLKVYVPLFIFGLIGLFIQSSGEELLFRGYVMQFARRLTSSPVLIILASAILFARPHLTNLSVLGMPSYAILLYLIDGIFVGWLAYRTRSVWMSAGFHLGNNFGLMVLVAEANSQDLLRGSPLLTTDNYASVELQIIVTFVVYLAITLIINWLFKLREQKAATQ